MISNEEVFKLAALARLKLTDEEVVGLQKDISNILEYVGQVSAVSTGAEKVFPLTRNILRADELRAPGDTMAGKEETIKTAFPIREGDHNVVRKIIQKDE